MSRDAFLAEFKRSFVPTLRKEGFRGTGVTFRRQIGPLAHVVNLQGSSGGQHCYLNLGAHLAFLAPIGGEPPDLAKLKEYECAFRTRVDPEPKSAHGWPYGSSVEESHDSVAKLCAAYNTQGSRFFGQFASYPQSFASVVPASLDASEAPHALASGSALVWARIALQLGNVAVAREFAKLGLAKAPSRASLYRAECERIAAGP